MRIIEVPDTRQGTMLINAEAIMLVKDRTSEPGSVIVMLHKIDTQHGKTREIGTSLTQEEIQERILGTRLR